MIIRLVVLTRTPGVVLRCAWERRDPTPEETAPDGRLGRLAFMRREACGPERMRTRKFREDSTITVKKS